VHSFLQVGRFARTGDKHDDLSFRVANAASTITKDFDSDKESFMGWPE
jgi:hypothetical protein